MTGWVYWLVFAVAALCFAAPWLASRYERRQDERDRQAWEQWWR